MAAAYTLNYSDPTKTSTITITGPIKNNYDTSLDLVGPGYVNYGQAIAQDFLKLLENFASPFPPVSPIEGQLWYDTSNPNRKVLRVNNGAATSARWPSANGIYQQTNDPNTQYSQNLVDGDIWVDTGNSQLKIRNGESWTTVGPNVTSGENKTGTENTELVSNTGDTYPVILNWVNGKVVEIISYNSFTPRTVIDGFGSLSAGINLTNKVAAKYNGLVDRAKSLEVSSGVYIQASEILKNRIPTSTRQTHYGTFVVESSSGLVVRRPNNNYELQVYTTSSGGVINYDNVNSGLKVGINTRSYIKFNASNGNIGINTSTVESVALSVNGAATFKESISVNSVSSSTVGLALTGSATVGGNLGITGSLNVVGITTISNILNVAKDIIPSNGIVTLGSAANPFERIYVANIGSTSTNTFINIVGIVTTATQLATGRDFQVSGHVTSSAVKFNGTTSATFTTTLTRSVISNPVGGTTSTTTATQTLMVLNTATGLSELQSISKSNFLADVYPNLLSTGMIMPYATSATAATIAAGWLYCDGSEHTSTLYASLFALIGNNYGTPVNPAKFKVPDLTTATVSGTNGYPIFYHIKT